MTFCLHTLSRLCRSEESCCLAEAVELLRECADDLAAELEGHYEKTKDHPGMARRYRRDMDVVYRAREFLADHDKGTPSRVVEVAVGNQDHEEKSDGEG